ncbi:MAG: hypothetical protein HFE73_02585 [Firmicutes bacterium]|nr:hypothetical protein [Bacillota bacterium]
MGEKESFKTVFFRFYDRKIGDGTVTFSQIGIAKEEFTRLCMEPNFVPKQETVERLCTNMKLTEEEAKRLRAAAEAGRES